MLAPLTIALPHRYVRPARARSLWPALPNVAADSRSACGATRWPRARLPDPGVKSFEILMKQVVKVAVLYSTYMLAAVIALFSVRAKRGGQRVSGQGDGLDS